ncbi:hypothetical protein [Microbacterium sp.]|uniref:hypothetical protein n=1 Tax=Microbacterium sp. TaxID=51671 RepID=UPI0039E532CB
MSDVSAADGTPLARDTIVAGTADVVGWWLENRQAKKLAAGAKETININPFLLPLIAGLHGTDTVEELGELLIDAHLIGGHNTGFGKLFDEKLLPQVFGTSKLDKTFRAKTAPYSQSAFNDIDHVVHRGDHDDLLSLKASPWTINLGGARDLNTSFADIRLHHINPYPGKYGEIAVGVLTGTASTLTDKYQILRGETPAQRKKHDVTDLTDTVTVYAGREFWTWLNGGESATQDWVLEGVLTASRRIGESNAQRNSIKELVRSSAAFRALGAQGDAPDWAGVLRKVNG